MSEFRTFLNVALGEKMGLGLPGYQMYASPIQRHSKRDRHLRSKCGGSDLESRFRAARPAPKAGFRTKGSRFARAKHALFRNDEVRGLCVSDSGFRRDDGIGL